MVRSVLEVPWLAVRLASRKPSAKCRYGEVRNDARGHQEKSRDTLRGRELISILKVGSG